MNDRTQAQRLLEILKDHDIPLTSDDVLWAFESPDTRDDVTSWIEEYLNPATLLSKEELELSHKLSKKNAPYNNPSTTKLPSLGDEDLVAALSCLQSSTDAIEKQCINLAARREALQTIQANSKPSALAGRAHSDRRRRQADEKAQLSIDVEEASSVSREKLSTARRSIETVANPLLNLATEQLGSDDRTMGRLSKVLQILDANLEERQDFAQIQTWCDNLASLREKEVNAKIDVKYASSLVALSKAGHSQRRAGDLNVEKRELQEELKSLRSEVASVAGMRVNHELQEPVLQHSKSLSSSKADSQQFWLVYISSSIKFMIERLEKSSSHIDHLVAYNDALGQLEKALIPEQPNPAQAPSKSHRRSSSFPVNPNFLPRQTAPVPASIGRLLQHLDISLEMRTGRNVASALDVAVSQRLGRFDDQHASAESNLVHDAGEVLDSAIAGLDHLMDALYTNTRYKTVSMGNTEQEARLQRLELGMAEIGKEMAGAESSQVTLDEDHGEAILGKWAK